MSRLLIALFSSILVGAPVLAAQGRGPMAVTTPGATGDPVWQGTVQLSDGRALVTDGGLAIDVALAKPAKRPERVIPGKVLEDHMKATPTEECRLGDLSRASETAFRMPSGVTLSAAYVTFLRRVLPNSTVLRGKGPGQPVVVVANGTPVGVLMPLAQ